MIDGSMRLRILAIGVMASTVVLSWCSPVLVSYVALALVPFELLAFFTIPFHSQDLTNG